VSLLDDDPVIADITAKQAALRRTLHGMVEQGRIADQAFAVANAANKEREAEALSAGEAPPPDLVPEIRETAGAARRVVDELRRLAMAYDRRLAELCSDIEAEASQRIAEVAAECGPSADVITGGVATINERLRLVARARTALALANPTRIVRPHPGERTRTDYTIARSSQCAGANSIRLASYRSQPRVRASCR
jgi:hypothetical protein